MSTPPVAVDPLLAWRTRFPSVEGVLHFASHTLGAMPAEAEAALVEYATAWGQRSVRAWEERWMAVPAEVAGSVEKLIQAEPGSISLHPNVTVAQAVALSCLEFAPGRDRVVCSAEDFPSELYLYEGLARRGAEIVRVPARDGRRIEEADLVAAIDERTALVAVSHVLFRTSQLLDLAPVLAKARAAGAISMVDAYQSVGIVDVDLSRLEPDFLTGGSIKWLCGGPGTGYLYVSPRVHARLHPALTGWFAHEQPFAFDSGPQRLHAGERRFWNGTPCIPAYCAARPGFAIAAEIGGEALREKSLRLTGRLLALADEYGFNVVSPREEPRRGGTVCLDVPNAEQVCKRLLADDALLDFRPGVGIRLAPHHYTRDDEVDEIMTRVRHAVDAER
ncbi:MAG TPA: aminotransferase class V-fold PLP-dependent enzyme [Candidatus Eisenbacteria bacterium]|jgi:kynureninase